ncbi:MAG: hypothetical protein J0L96_13215 [Anaerolineae bacterium]|nr:hypothetical protein [Anaerolineae bacterium]
MEVSRIENLPPPPGIIQSIKAGFDAVAGHITAILLPFALNLFLWLGPRLRMDALFKSMEPDLVLLWKAAQIPMEDIRARLDMYEKVTESFNLFSILRTLPIGISSLFTADREVFSTPVGNPDALQISFISFPFWFFLLLLIGWVGGALYFRAVASAALTDKITSVSPFHAVFQTVLISILGNLLLIVLVMPLMVILYVAAQISVVLVNLVVLFLALASMWVIVPFFFWAHGVFLSRQNVLTSMLSSLQLTRFTLPNSSLFVLTIFLLSYGLSLLWKLPALDSWLTVLGIFGHSFVTTALLAGSFIYYYEMSAWVRAVLEKLRPNSVIKQA